MIFTLKKDILADKGAVGKAAAVLAVVGSKASGIQWTSQLRQLDKICGGVLSAAVADGYAAKSGETCVLYPAPTKISYRRLIIIGRGTSNKPPAADIERAIAALPPTIKSLILLCDKETLLAAAAVAAAGYRYRLAAAMPLSPQLQRVFVEGNVTARQLSQLSAVGDGVRLARHLAEQPGNICTPSYLAATAKRLARGGLAVKIIERKEMTRLGMGGLLAVSQGSAQPPKLIVMRHAPSGFANRPPIVLVGKGVTFDTGGISLKPSAAMDEMKFDMGGAASVFGAMQACAKMKLPLHVIGIVPSCENMPDGAAVKPGDVIKMMNGKTVEILNTDAEGRLILGDALTYSARFKPSAVVDVATLTGAVVIALGDVHSGLMANDDALAAELLAAGRTADDDCWRLPLGEKYDKLLKSDYADFANIGGRSAGTITAACFLSHFVSCKSWAHLDIAGTAWNRRKRATGRPVPLLMKFLLNRAGW